VITIERAGLALAALASYRERLTPQINKKPLNYRGIWQNSLPSALSVLGYLVHFDPKKYPKL
jgi:hypothetical protein